MNESTRRDFVRTLSTALLSLGICGCRYNGASRTEETEALFEHLKIVMGAIVSERKAVGVAFGVQSWGSPAMLGAIGKSFVDRPIPLSADTPMRIASITKIFVAAGTMKLVESGKLSLNQPINDFFPNYPNGNKVTIYHLLSHTSGLKDWWEAGLPESTPGDFPQQPQPHRALEQASDPFHFQPGEHHWYSNTGFILLGDIIETVSGQRLGEFLERELFLPAKLQNIYYEPTEAQSKDWCAGHHLAPESEPPFKQTDFNGSPGAAGGIWSTAGDLLRWSEALYNGSLLTEETVARMSQFALLADGRPVHQSTWLPSWMDTPPSKSDFIEESGWGLGFSVFTSNGQKVVWHSGGIPGFNAIWINIPSKSLSISMLANTDNGVVPAFNKIMPLATEES